MKTKLLFIVVFFAVAVSASAQFNWGVKAGFNASTISGVKGALSEENAPLDMKYRPGFHVGIMTQYMMTEHFGIESGLYYTTLGVNGSYDENLNQDNYAKINVNFSPNYLQLPISALYKIKVGENLSLNPSLGIYLGYGIGGKAKTTADVVVDGEPLDLDYLNYDADFFGKTDGEEFANRFDMGATVGLNLQFEKFLIGLGYDYGFMKINKEKIEKNWYNGNVKVSVGYLF